MLRNVIAMDGCESPNTAKSGSSFSIACISVGWSVRVSFRVGRAEFLFTVLSPLLVFAPLLDLSEERVGHMLECVKVSAAF